MIVAIRCRWGRREAGFICMTKMILFTQSLADRQNDCLHCVLAFALPVSMWKMRQFYPLTNSNRKQRKIPFSMEDAKCLPYSRNWSYPLWLAVLRFHSSVCTIVLWYKQMRGTEALELPNSAGSWAPSQHSATETWDLHDELPCEMQADELKKEQHAKSGPFVCRITVSQLLRERARRQKFHLMKSGKRVHYLTYCGESRGRKICKRSCTLHFGKQMTNLQLVISLGRFQLCNAWKKALNCSLKPCSSWSGWFQVHFKSHSILKV